MTDLSETVAYEQGRLRATAAVAAGMTGLLGEMRMFLTDRAHLFDGGSDGYELAGLLDEAERLREKYREAQRVP